MCDNVMMLSADRRIVRVDTAFWYYYVNLDREKGLDRHKCGKWMHFFTDLDFAEDICRRAVLEEAVAECKHNAPGNFHEGGQGVICFYLNAGDFDAHRRVLAFMLENDLIRKTKKGKLFDIAFKLDDQTRAGEYGPNFKPTIKLSEFVDLETGEFPPAFLEKAAAPCIGGGENTGSDED